MKFAIDPIDVGIIVLYFVLVIGLGCWAGMRQRRGSKDEGDSYFLAGKSLAWPVIGLAMFSTNISTSHLVGFAQEGYKNGLVFGNFEWMAAFTLIALSLFFAPFYIKANIATLPDFLEKRYNTACRDYLAIISIVSAIFIHMGTCLYAGAVVLEGMFGIDILTSIIVIALLTGLYTVVGGLLAVVLTESIQTIILLAGAICITVIGYDKVGGWHGLTQSVEPVKLTMLRPASDSSGLSWYSIFLGYPIIGIWYWCADQTIVQRVLGAKDENHARIGPIFAGFLKVLPVFLFVLPGIFCFAWIKQQHLAPLKDSANAYAFMITNWLPVGLKGVVAAALLAALMSTVSGALNSIATLFCYDICKRRNPNIPDGKLVLLGRIVTVVAMVAAMIWSPQMKHFSSLCQGAGSMICYIAPPITAVFVWGVFSRRTSATGAIVTLWSGFALGFGVFLLDWYKAVTHWPIPFMMGTFYLFLVCSAILLIVSYLKPQKHSEESASLVWDKPMDAVRGAWRGISDYRLLSAILFISIVVLYVIFK